MEDFEAVPGLKAVRCDGEVRNLVVVRVKEPFKKMPYGFLPRKCNSLA